MSSPRYRVVVGNIGTVLETNRFGDAIQTYSHYKGLSKADVGRAAGEDVTLFDGDEIKWEHTGRFNLEEISE